MTAILGLAILLVLQAIGEVLSHALSLPLPGPVLGMALLLPALRLDRIRAPVRAASEMLLAHLSLLFVPVGVGIITHLGLVGDYGIRLLVVIVLSTWFGLATTAVVLQRLSRGAPEREVPKSQAPETKDRDE